MYQKLKIWQESLKLIKEIYKYAEKLPKNEEYNLKSQIKRAVISVTLNIAEGKCRKTSKDFAHFLNVSSASLSEVECILLICESLNYFSVDENLYNDIKSLNRQIDALCTKLVKDVKYE